MAAVSNGWKIELLIVLILHYGSFKNINTIFRMNHQGRRDHRLKIFPLVEGHLEAYFKMAASEMVKRWNFKYTNSLVFH